MRKIEVKIRQFIWVIKNLFKPTTYDYVIYNGNKYWIKASLTGDNIWNLFDVETKEEKFSYIHGDKLKIVHSYKRFISVYKFNMTFQKWNWERIDCMNPIGTRLSFINSDNIKFYR